MSAASNEVDPPARGPSAFGRVELYVTRGIDRVKRLPVRWRLALTSAGLTFGILALFALVVGVFTARQVYGSFDNELRLTADNLQAQLANVRPWNALRPEISDQMIDAINTGDAAIRFVAGDGTLMSPPDARDLGPPQPGLHDVRGYRVATRALTDPEGHPYAFLEYGKRLSNVHHTIARVRLFLFVGVLAGTALALLAGLGLARRAIAPIANLTRAAKDIARTRNPGLRIPKPQADDEVADLARTLEEMLIALDSARSETQAALDRQREFVADASHELRTPLTSILANLELLEAELSGEDADIAGSALRSSRRMRRLVGDLLLLARADAGRPSPRERVELGGVVREAAGEAMPLAPDHKVSIDVPGDDALAIRGTSDELHRLVLNLIQNAVLHTPAGTSVEVAARRAGDDVVLTVSDDGPGIPADLRDRIFDRFVRGAGDRGGANGRGSGLGLAIVRAVAEAHGGTVQVADSESGGARFTVSLPALAAGSPAPERAEASA
jgi:two-component system, OmpR family, sensor kinase